VSAHIFIGSFLLTAGGALHSCFNLGICIETGHEVTITNNLSNKDRSCKRSFASNGRVASTLPA
jgi:hypothetical protein